MKYKGQHIASHSHIYAGHPTDESRVYCTLCGLSIPKAFLPYALEHGATSTGTKSNQKEE